PAHDEGLPRYDFRVVQWTGLIRHMHNIKPSATLALAIRERPALPTHESSASPSYWQQARQGRNPQRSLDRYEALAIVGRLLRKLQCASCHRQFRNSCTIGVPSTPLPLMALSPPPAEATPVALLATPVALLLRRELLMRMVEQFPFEGFLFGFFL